MNKRASLGGKLKKAYKVLSLVVTAFLIMPAHFFILSPMPIAYASDHLPCPIGFEEFGDFCEPIICEVGEILVGDFCEPIICEVGEILVGDFCEPIICEPGFELIGDTCEPLEEFICHAAGGSGTFTTPPLGSFDSGWLNGHIGHAGDYIAPSLDHICVEHDFDCGNDIIESPEECEPSIYIGDGFFCSEFCTIEPEIVEPIDVCPLLDGVQDTVPEGYILFEGFCEPIICEPGYTLDVDQCVHDEPICGDGIVYGGGDGVAVHLYEQCDDGNNVDGDGCSAICELEAAVIEPDLTCHDYSFEEFETCFGEPAVGECEKYDLSPEEGDYIINLPDFAALGKMMSECVESSCGDSYVDDNEQCDDGNNTDGDGCSAICELEQTPDAYCGDFKVDPGEQCDDGNILNGDGCSYLCQFEINQCEFPLLLDFDELEKGEIVTDQYALFGISISAENNNGDHPDNAVIFDSASPSGGDFDLGTPNEAFAGPGIGAGGLSNLIDLFKLLIIGEDDVDEAPDDGFIDNPDDEAAGGKLIVEFDEAVAVTYLDVIDIEEEGGTVKGFNAGNAEIFSEIIADVGDNSYQNILVNQDEFETRKLEVELVQSGAIDNLAVCLTHICGDDSIDGGEQCDDGNTQGGDGCSAQCQLEDGPQCEELDPEQKGWHARYFNYPGVHPDMNLHPSLWPDDGHGDPQSDVIPWDTNWYDDDPYFRFSRIDSSLEFGADFFPLDIAIEEEDNGHDYHFGIHWRGLAMVDIPGTYFGSISSDDDAWLYLDGELITDNSGIQSVSTELVELELTGSNVIDIYFAERHVTDSFFSFGFRDDIMVKPLPPGCEPNGEDPFCGDGIVNQAWEQCDDGNNEGGDGCSAICQEEIDGPTCGEYDYDEFISCFGGTPDGVCEKYDLSPEEGDDIINLPDFAALGKIFATCGNTGALELCKYIDVTGDGASDDDVPYTGGWGMEVFPYVATTTPLFEEITSENGCVIIDPLIPGHYAVDEENKDSWSLTDIVGDIFETDLFIVDSFFDVFVDVGTTTTSTISFYNHFQDQNSVHECSDGLDNEDDGFTDIDDPDCHTDDDPGNSDSYDPTRDEDNDDSDDGGGGSTTVTTSSSGGGGSGGGGGSPGLNIHTENIVANSVTKVTLTWFTNVPATTRVVYGAVSNDPILSPAPNYGYTDSTIEDTTKKTFHTVMIDGLTPDTIYYFRPISSNSSETDEGVELTITLTEDVVVLGENTGPSGGVGGPPPEGSGGGGSGTTGGGTGSTGGTGEPSVLGLITGADAEEDTPDEPEEKTEEVMVDDSEPTENGPTCEGLWFFPSAGIFPFPWCKYWPIVVTLIILAIYYYMTRSKEEEGQ
jgi:cysteine-rich repeat protein